MWRRRRTRGQMGSRTVEYGHPCRRLSRQGLPFLNRELLRVDMRPQLPKLSIGLLTLDAWPHCGLACADPLGPELVVELVAALADPVASVLPDWVLPVVLAFPYFAAGPESDVVFSEPDCPPAPESPEAPTGLEVALVVAEAPAQVAVMLVLGATVTTDPELPEGDPELPGFDPELPDAIDPSALADPVGPEVAVPDEALVSVPLVEVAAPEVPPVVVPLAVELPPWPDVAGAVMASTVLGSPGLAVLVASPDWVDPGP